MEGIGAIGLITYMRTDSLRISEDARKEGNDFIRETYGADYLPAKPRTFKSRNNAQDAHEAIRPSMPSLTPDRVKESLTSDQFRLYKLICDRFIASLMANCVHDTCQVDIRADKYLFKASGYTVRFEGYTVQMCIRDRVRTGQKGKGSQEKSAHRGNQGSPSRSEHRYRRLQHEGETRHSLPAGGEQGEGFHSVPRP